MQNSEAQNKALRVEYKPDDVRILFVGGSQPRGPQFFYDGKRNMLITSFRKALRHIKGDTPQEFLNSFKAAGYYLADLVPVAVNDGAVTPQERKRLCREGVPALRHEIQTLQPNLVVCFMKGIAPYVAQAAKGFETRVVSFPAMGHQLKFHAKMAELLPEILARSGGADA